LSDADHAAEGREAYDIERLGPDYDTIFCNMLITLDQQPNKRSIIYSHTAMTAPLSVFLARGMVALQIETLATLASTPSLFHWRSDHP
jgi:hypothetical protein